MQDIKPIEAEIIKAQTTRDGAFRITLDIQNFNKDVAHYLMDRAVDNECLTFVIIDADRCKHGVNNGEA